MGSASPERAPAPTSPDGRGGRRPGPGGDARRDARPTGVHVVRLTPDDWRSYAALRIGMLTHAPEAFWSRLEDLEGRTEEQWRRSSNDRTLHARDADGTPLGTLTVLTPEAGPDLGLRPGAGDALVLAVYVIPEARGGGVVDLLLDAALELAREELGARRMVLQVNERNGAARRVYERHGYRLTGHSLPHPHQVGTRDLEMARPV
ncbi:GNAT family N-acetyltransferase [Ornithinimicrobium flavum]|uniref:GNAT family N-acetyltransferase n=1 Tax=Ornithinimicrobium flavum TaxID=1288636 RepID=UPI00106FD93C|nr:GNAT family N-acetyltransferase [Ornithinimicrobium flavum]